MKLLLLISLLALAVVALDYKRLNGSPETFARHRIPDPANAAQQSNHAMIPLRLTPDATLTQDVLIDSAIRMTVALYSPLADDYTMELTMPDGTRAPDVDEKSLSFPLSDSGSSSVPGHGWVFDKPQLGHWTLKISPKKAVSAARNPSEPVHDVKPNCFLVVHNDSPVKMHSHLASYSLEQDETVGVVSKLSKSSVVHRAELEVMFPDSTRQKFDMFDDGLHADGEAGDGTYGGSFNATQRGLYKVSPHLRGTLAASGLPFMRSVSHLMEVVQDDVELLDSPAQLRAADKEKFILRILVGGASQTGTMYRVYAEVWGAEDKAVAWVGGFYPKLCVEKVCYLDVELDAHWIKRAGIEFFTSNALELREVYVADYVAHVPLSEQKKLKVTMKSKFHLASLVQSLPHVSEPTESMRWGRRPEQLVAKLAAKMNNSSLFASLPDLVLLHGWCAQQLPWEGGKFTNARQFKELGQSLATTVFAEHVVAAVADLPSFSLVAHSQGGFVAAHIHNYFWTGLENSQNGRKIQSVGTPYMGTTGAGSGADFIAAFGIGCGANFDLSPEGSALWSAGIEEKTRDDVYFYLTQWKDEGLVKYCNLASNLVLKYPNDGVSEVENGPLEGGHDMGVLQGECHTLNMKWPPQYRDNDRNVIMNKEAAR